MLKIKSVTIEGLHSVDKKTYHFDGLNYLKGPNGSGKSTALQAIQLALLGYIPGTNKRSEAIFAHASNHTMAVTVTLSDGDSDVASVRRLWVSANGKVTSMVDVTPEGFDIESIVTDLELPVFNFNEFVGMTANSLKKWFIDFLPNSGADIDWNAVLTEALKDIKLQDASLLADAIANVEGSGKVGVDAVAHLNNYIKAMMTSKKAELSRIQSTIQTLVFHDDCAQYEDTADIQAEIDKYTEWQTALMKAEFATNCNAQVQKGIDEIQLAAEVPEDDPDYVSAAAAYHEASSADKNARTQIAILEAEKKELDVQHGIRIREISETAKIVTSGGVCNYTGKICPEIVNMIDEMKLLMKNTQEEASNLSNRQDQINEDIRRLSTIATDAQNRANDAAAKMSQIKRKYVVKASLYKQLVDVPDTSHITMTRAEVECKVRELNELYRKVAANMQYRQLIDKLTKDKFLVEQSMEALKVWDKLTGPNGLQNSLMTEPFENLAHMMDSYVPLMFGDGVLAGFNLSDKANSFNFGITRNGRYIPFELLSSGEKCIYTLCLTMSLTQCSTSPLKLILIDDLFDHLDDDKMNKVVETLATIPDIQFIFAGVKDFTYDYKDDIIIEVK